MGNASSVLNTKFPVEISNQYNSHSFDFYLILQNIICKYFFELILNKNKFFNWQNPNTSFIYEFSDKEKQYLLTKTDDEIAFIMQDFTFCTYFSFPLNIQRNNISGRFTIKFNSIKAFKIQDFKLHFNINLEYTQRPNTYFDFHFIQMFDYQKITSYFLTKMKDLINLRSANIPREHINYLPDYINSFSYPFNSLLTLSPLQKEVFELIIHIFLTKQSDKIIFTTDDILELKNTPKSTNSKGFKGGYTNTYRKEINEAINTISNLKDNFQEALFLTSNYQKLSESKSKYRYTFTTSEALKEILLQNENLIKLPAKIFRYHHNKELYEKTFSKFILKNKKIKQIQVKNLIFLVISKDNIKRGNIVREKFEFAMDKLVEDKIIRSWTYKNINETDFEYKYWLDKWLDIYLKITI